MSSATTLMIAVQWPGVHTNLLPNLQENHEGHEARELEVMLVSAVCGLAYHPSPKPKRCIDYHPRDRRKRVRCNPLFDA